MNLLSTTLAVFAVLAMPLTTVQAQQPDINETIEMMRSVVALERKAIISKALQLSGSESTEFWSVYDEYSAEKKRVNDRLVTIVTQYAENYENLSDELARSLVDDHMKVQNDLLKVRKKYLRKFDRVLSPRKVARFYQVENKLDAVARVRLAQQIPLVLE